MAKTAYKPLVIGIDVGTKRVGVAISDNRGVLSSPLITFARAKGVAEKRIIELISERKINTVVVGIPLSASGEKTLQCEDIENFCRRLLRRLSVEIVYIDEFLSSEEAKQRLKIPKSKAKEQRQKGVIDSAAASIILQAYLDGQAEAGRA